MRNILDFLMCWNQINRIETTQDLESEVNGQVLIEEKNNLINKIIELEKGISVLENELTTNSPINRTTAEIKSFESTKNNQNLLIINLKESISENAALEKIKKSKKVSKI